MAGKYYMAGTELRKYRFGWGLKERDIVREDHQKTLRKARYLETSHLPFRYLGLYMS